VRAVRIFGVLTALLSVLVLPNAALAQPVLSSAQRLANLEAAVSSLTQAVTALQAENAAQSTLLQSQASEITALKKQIADSKAYTDSVGASTLASARTYTDGKVAPVADKLVHFSRNGNEVYITGANLNIRNGTGYTYQVVNGLGNLIVGYNELRTGTGAVNTRTGSHNVILGFNQNYSAAGAFMSGAVNNSTNHFASVIGGTGNSSGGFYSVVVGGYDNQATGNWSTVLGGQGVRATTQLAHVP
jgi:hypothetical protein